MDASTLSLDSPLPDDVATLQDLVVQLLGLVACWRTENVAQKCQLDEVLAELSRLRAENAELKGQLRTLSHRRVFDRLAKERGAPEDSLDLIWQASGHKAEKDDEYLQQR